SAVRLRTPTTLPSAMAGTEPGRLASGGLLRLLHRLLRGAGALGALGEAVLLGLRIPGEVVAGALALALHRLGGRRLAARRLGEHRGGGEGGKGGGESELLEHPCHSLGFPVPG